MKYPAYPDYRPVHSPALKQLPAHWQLKRLRFATTGIEQGWSPQCDNEVADDDRWGVMKVGCVNGDRFDPLENKALPADLDPMPAYELKPGDVLVSRANTQELVGSAAVVPEGVRPRLLLCDKLFRIRPQAEVQARFLTYLLRTPAARYQYERDATGASGSMQNIGQDTIKNLSIPLPSTGEQAAITDFLDWRTAQIDALIAKKLALIQRLDEAFYARMAFVLTGKRSLSSTLRPSGVAWLGEVPAHWQVMKLSRVVEARCDGPFGSGLKSEHYVDQGVRVVRLQNIGNAEFLNGDAAFIDPEHYRELGDHDVLPGDLLIAGLGDNNTPVGRACVAPEGLGPAMVKADCFRYRLDTQMAHAPFIAYQLSISAWLLRGALASGVTRARMNLSATSDRVLAFPPIDEQKAIAIELDSERQRADSVKRKVHEAIERLTEHRSALITAAVTGQIDVRGVPVPV